jgi:hypothetical protein
VPGPDDPAGQLGVAGRPGADREHGDLGPGAAAAASMPSAIAGSRRVEGQRDLRPGARPVDGLDRRRGPVRWRAAEAGRLRTGTEPVEQPAAAATPTTPTASAARRDTAASELRTG